MNISFFSFLRGLELKTFVLLQHFRDTKFVESVIPKLLFPFIQTLHNDCSQIGDVYLLFCEQFIFFSLFCRARIFFGPTRPEGQVV